MSAPIPGLPNPQAAKARIRECLRASHAEVIALQELGSHHALAELQASLKSEGLDYPYSESIAGADTNIHLAVLSRFPITARRPHTNESFLLFDRRFRVSRGFAELEIQVTPSYSFTLLAAHLKSRVPVAQADESDLRQQEAALLRAIVTQRLKADPDLNLVVLGDFNDTRDSKTLRTLLGRGKSGLVDTRPAERNGDTAFAPKPNAPPRNITWTYFYDKSETYSRIDYILISHAMAPEWEQKETCVLALPDWGIASDHRPIIAAFYPENRSK